ncbi:MAG: delta-60 repeat domain-containing protein, partial [Verrucomicrobiota bacterium]|nr:delta-60 repeat domain-containing protein [Verrucomicrobiota bacterium]
GLADSFNPSPSGNGNLQVLAIALRADGKVVAGGSYSTLSPPGGAGTRNNIARLETDGRLDQTLPLGTIGSYVAATAVQPDGKLLIGGSFSFVLSVSRNNIARLNTDGTLDTAFNPNANSFVNAIAV